MSPARVLACGAWDRGDGYPRPRSLLESLRSAGHVVDECRFELPYSGPGKRRLAARPHLWPGLLLHLARARSTCRRQLRAAIAEYRPDVVLVPYPGHLVVPWIRTVFPGPILLDLFLSAHDTLVEDRRRFRPGSLLARALRHLDRRACAAADLVLLDTPEHAARVAQLVDLPRDRFAWVPVSDPDAPPAAVRYRAPSRGGPLDLLFFGTGVPLHGLDHLLEAVECVPEVRLTLVGGATGDRTRASRLGPERLRLLDTFVSRGELAAELERCALVAGIFSAGGKAQRVVPFKVVHALAAGRPVITADTPAVRSLLSPGEDCLVCAPGDARALAAVLAALVEDPDPLEEIARHARRTYDGVFSSAAVAARLDLALSRILVKGSAPSREPSAEFMVTS